MKHRYSILGRVPRVYFLGTHRWRTYFFIWFFQQDLIIPIVNKFNMTTNFLNIFDFFNKIL
jgi:hypothetical protein